MTIPLEYVFIVVSLLILLSIFASKLAARLSIPALLLFLLIGMLAGSDGPGGIYFDDAQLAQTLGVVALTFILFTGGLDTDWKLVRPALAKAISLSTLGVLLTAISVGWFAVAYLNFSPIEGVLLGAIISSTDAAAVFAVLRGKSVGLKGQLKAILELESGSNDPMAIFLTIGFTRLLVEPETSIIQLVPMFVQQMALGALLGYLLGRMMTALINLLRLEYDGLYPVLTIALVLFVYGVTASVGGNGFLAVYITGLVVGNSDFIHRRSLIRFHDGLAWLMQIVMFLALGLLVFPSRLVQIVVPGLLTAAFLMFVARPVSVFVSLLNARLSVREKLFISGVGLRGAAPIILATFPLLAGVEKADAIFNLVFFVVLTSVLLQGTTLVPLAKLLHLDAPPTPPTPTLELIAPNDIRNKLVEMQIPAYSTLDGKRIVDLGLPEGGLIVLISRNQEVIVPGGSTVLRSGDNLLVFADRDLLQHLQNMMEADVDEQHET